MDTLICKHCAGSGEVLSAIDFSEESIFWDCPVCAGKGQIGEYSSYSKETSPIDAIKEAIEAMERLIEVVKQGRKNGI